MQPTSKIAEVRVNKLAANIVGTLLLIVSCVAGVWLARLLPHYSAPAGWHAVALIVSVIVLFPVHEALHAVGLVRLAGVSWSHIRFGMMWRALMPYCHCMVPISVRAYRRMALLPLLVTGIVTVTALLFYPTDWLGLLTGCTVASCVGDVWMIVRLRRFSDGCLVQDSPSEIGCDVYSEISQT